MYMLVVLYLLELYLIHIIIDIYYLILINLHYITHYYYYSLLVLSYQLLFIILGAILSQVLFQYYDSQYLEINGFYFHVRYYSPCSLIILPFSLIVHYNYYNKLCLWFLYCFQLSSLSFSYRSSLARRSFIVIIVIAPLSLLFASRS